MEEATRQGACECMFEVKAKAGQDVITQGDKGDTVYIVESGTYEVFLEQVANGTQSVHAYTEPGDSFGELAVMYSCRRAATVRCVQGGKLWGLDRASYKEICKQEGAADDVACLLRDCAALKHCDARAVFALTNSLQMVMCAKGQRFIEKVC